MDIMRETPDTMVKAARAGKAACHVSRDSTATEAREEPQKKEKREGKTRRGRPKKGEIRPAKPETAVEKQIHESPEDSLKTIDTACARGCKKNSRGAVRFWTGYKPRLDVSDTGFPLGAFVSGANVHDGQLAIPPEKMTEGKVFFCYSLTGAYQQFGITKSFP
jgi:hypothetical protein